METRNPEGCIGLVLSGGVVVLAVGLVLVVVIQLSSDAAGMAVGLLFGMMAGIPTALLTLYGVRQSQPARDELSTRIDRVMIVDRQGIVGGSTSYGMVESGQSKVGSD